jgi:hypothetical protein
LDLGELKDFTALVLVERWQPYDAPTVYRVRDLRRWELRTRYPVIVQDVVHYLTMPRLGRPVLRDVPSWVAIDATGVGRAVWEQFTEQPELRSLRQSGRLRAITITGGTSYGFDKGSMSWHVPKKDLVGAVQSTLGTGQLKASTALELAPVLRKELEMFRAKVNISTGHESYEAWRDRDHDDLVLALALALWQALRAPSGGVEEPVGALTPALRPLPGMGDAPLPPAGVWEEW